jgi:hypothetical protein
MHDAPGYKGMLAHEIMAEWAKGCHHIPAGSPPGDCIRCTRSALQAIQRPIAWAANFFRRTVYAVKRNPKHALDSNHDFGRASAIVDYYIINQVIK